MNYIQVEKSQSIFIVIFTIVFLLLGIIMIYTNVKKQKYFYALLGVGFLYLAFRGIKLVGQIIRK